jgi:AraC-like DNA-binding protein
MLSRSQGGCLNAACCTMSLMSRPLIDQECFVRLARSRDFLAADTHRCVRIPDAARVAGISRHHYIRLYARAFGETPQEFVTRRRLEHAQRLLRGGSLSIMEVCLEVGYQSLGSFSTLFRRNYGVCPRDYRRLWSFPGAALLFSIPPCFAAFWR